MKRSEKKSSLIEAIKTNKAYSTLLGVSIATPILMGVYGWNPGASMQAVGRNLANLNTKVIGEITKMGFGYQRSITDNTAILNEAIKTSISQESMASTQMAKADKDAKQLSVEYKKSAQIANDMIDARLRFGAQTGQGYNACLVLAQNKQLDKGIESAKDTAFVKVNELDNSPGTVVDNPQAAMQARQDQHRENFCTPEEKAADKCDKVSDLPGADANAATLFVSSKPGSLISEAKTEVRQNILGSPVLGLPYKAGQTITGQAYLASVNQKTALAAFPAYSLAYLESMSQVRDDLKDEKGNPQSPNDMLFNTVARYYGGPNAKDWAKSMIEQQPRGLMVELAKMEGLGAWMDYQEYKANQRIEGNLAALTLTSAMPMEESLKRLNQKMQRRTVASNIESANQF